MKQDELSFTNLDSQYEMVRCKNCPDSRHHCMYLRRPHTIPEDVCKRVHFTPYETLCELVDKDNPLLRAVYV